MMIYFFFVCNKFCELKFNIYALNSNYDFMEFALMNKITKPPIFSKF